MAPLLSGTKPNMLNPEEVTQMSRKPSPPSIQDSLKLLFKYNQTVIIGDVEIKELCGAYRVFQRGVLRAEVHNLSLAFDVTRQIVIPTSNVPN